MIPGTPGQHEIFYSIVKYIAVQLYSIVNTYKDILPKSWGYSLLTRLAISN